MGSPECKLHDRGHATTIRASRRSLMSNKDEVLRSLVLQHVHNGTLSEYREEYLLAKGTELGLNPDEAKNIIHSALKVCAEQNSRLQRFRDALQKEAQNGFPLAKDIEDDLKDWSQAVLGLTQIEAEEIWTEEIMRYASHACQEPTIDSPQGLAIQYEINKYDIYPMHIKSLAASKCSRFFAISMIEDSGLLGGFKVTQSKIRIYGFGKNDRLAQISEKALTLPGSDNPLEVTSLEFSPDGNYLYGLTYSDGFVIHKWDLKSQRLEWRSQKLDDVQAIRSSTSDDVLYAISPRRVYSLNCKTGEIINNLKLASGDLEDPRIAVCMTSFQLAITSKKGDETSIQLFDIRTGKLIRAFREMQFKYIYGPHFFLDGARLFYPAQNSSYATHAVIWVCDTGTQFSPAKLSECNMSNTVLSSISPCNKVYAVSRPINSEQSKIFLYCLDSNKEIFSLDCSETNLFGLVLEHTFLSFAGNGKHLILCQDRRRVAVYKCLF